MLKFRGHKETDKALVEKWIACDDEHSQTSTVESYCPPDDPNAQHKGVKFGVVEDEIGTIGYLVLENILRVSCQFPPAFEKDRIRAAIDEFIPQLIEHSRGQYKQIIFKSSSPALIFYLRKFGFRRSPTEIVCNIGDK